MLKIENELKKNINKLHSSVILIILNIFKSL